jgi:hypothetical protein
MLGIRSGLDSLGLARQRLAGMAGAAPGWRSWLMV